MSLVDMMWASQFVDPITGKLDLEAMEQAEAEERGEET